MAASKINHSIFLKLLVCLFFSQLSFAQFTIPKKPDFQTSIYDYAQLLSAKDKAGLEEKLIKYSDSTSTQIVVVTVETINNESIGILAPKWAHEWGIGQSKQDNGVFILLAKKERKIDITPGYGVEDRITAGIGGEIIRKIITPEFKTGNYYKGLDKGADAIFDVLKGKYKGERKKNKEKGLPILPIIVIVIVILALISKSKNSGGNSGNSGAGPSLLDVIILSSLGRSGGGFGGGGSSGGGGGFGGGFGGGGFSGGGSSGDW
jgi:uncharacterized protein